MKCISLIDEQGYLKQNVLIEEDKIETETYINNLRIYNIFNENGDWEEYKIFYVKYTNNCKIKKEIYPKEIFEPKISCFCKGYVDLNELKKRVSKF